MAEMMPAAVVATDYYSCTYTGIGKEIAKVLDT